MKIVMVHGYMLSGSGSNIYVQNLCRALVRTGYDVHLLCQDGDPLAYDFVNGSYTAGKGGIERRAGQETPYAGRCNVYLPQIGDLLPVYVYDDYPGWRVKTFLDLTGPEFDDYVTLNVAALWAVLDAGGTREPTSLVTNHSVPNPLIARRALEGTDVPYVSVVHGSCLQYVARKSGKYMEVAREGLAGAGSIVSLSEHATGTIREDFPELAGKTLTLPGGVDTGLFHPEALDLRYLEGLRGGAGRGPVQEKALQDLLSRRPETAGALAKGLREVSSTYNARAHDADAGGRLRAFLSASSPGSPLVIYVGKLIHSKGVHSLISAFARVRAETDARLLVVGFGTFREALEALTRSLGS
ncbi:MAG: glycosyltransferase, partial [Rubrobacter sp.]|nr:glycosyltransferase [Rubrobacter sp.]